jgi:hypothetical protein
VLKLVDFRICQVESYMLTTYDCSTQAVVGREDFNKVKEEDDKSRETLMVR